MARLHASQQAQRAPCSASAPGARVVRGILLLPVFVHSPQVCKGPSEFQALGIQTTSVMTLPALGECVKDSKVTCP